MKEIKHENIASYKPMPDLLAMELEKYNKSLLPMLPMEYCENGNLRMFLKQPVNICGLQEEELRFFLKDMNSAIAYLHNRKITHRDIKPENIVRQKIGKEQRMNCNIYKLIDLGYAKELNSVTVSFVGTLHYLAPEILMNETYNCNVDYWSFGIVVFEVICGILPFLHRKNPAQRHECLIKKSPDVIYIYETLSGETKYSNEITIENNVSPLLRKHLERWLRIMLRFDPKDRGLTGNSRNVFEELDHILNTRIIRVFSVFNYRIYHYEIDDTTMLSTLMDWIKTDTSISIEDQLLIMDNVYYDNNDRKVFECFDDIRPNSLLMLFNKRSFNDNSKINFPVQIRGLFSPKPLNIDILKTCTNFAANYMLNQANLMNCTRKALRNQYDYTANLFLKECQSLDQLKTVSNRLLILIGVLKNVNCTRLGMSADAIKEHNKCLRQCKELIENVNAANSRHRKLCVQETVLNASYKRISSFLNDLNPERYFQEAMACTSICSNMEQKPRKIVVLINTYVKELYELLQNDDIIVHFPASMKFLRETVRLMKWIRALHDEILFMDEQLQKNHVSIIQSLSAGIRTVHSQDLNTKLSQAFDGRTDQLIELNTALRYRIQENIDEIYTEESQNANNIPRRGLLRL
ncbi:PREDICTED: inhibitor of nuclear factor kappa-B kinase subunit beta-like isoform X2 [Nicrophorus vespilloides]|nr:PREDICTED: inhibitor of nuclear factor kappa-B kinase subunit beta-like isoform X2 [Nicrophorus vespilloides]